VREFTALFVQLDRTNRTAEKVEALADYFRRAPPEDAAWALAFLIGRRRRRAVSSRQLLSWVGEHSGWPVWLVEESYDRVGDLAETIALLVRSPGAGTDLPLHRLVSERLARLSEIPEPERKALMFGAWDELTREQCFVWNKLLTGGFRVGASRTLVARALAVVAGLPQAVMAHRLMGGWQPTAHGYGRLIAGERSGDPGQPYPFYLAYPLEAAAEELGPPADWQAEWKWDGIRAQLLVRGGECLVWTRGEELVTDQYPELAETAAALPEGTVLDGEILGWRDDAPLPFGALQRRLGRKRVGAKLQRDVPVVFMAFDLLEQDGVDIRELPLAQRRLRLEGIEQRSRQSPAFRLSPSVPFASWGDLAAARASSRQRRVEGLMLKRRESPYGVGRKKGDWWKWKIEPLTIDAVLTYAQRGHGRRASLYTDYTFGVWHQGELITVAKAYSGLTDEEISQVDAFVRSNTEQEFGPVHKVKPELVFELAFEDIRLSGRHKSGIALRFPRIARWRKDKRIKGADTLERVRALIGTARTAPPAA